MAKTPVKKSTKLQKVQTLSRKDTLSKTGLRSIVPLSRTPGA